MNALVLYDSKFGNTERIAEAVALVLQEALPTRLASVEEVGDCAEAVHDVDLLVVGGPTHAHGISEPMKAAIGCLGERAAAGVRVATFDTRVHGPRFVTGSAAVRLARLLRRDGGWLVVPPESFVVEGTEGPLQAGELERARSWAHGVLHAIGVHAPTPV